MPLILHIGSGKTGTTSIQNAFAVGAADETSEFLYPVAGGPDHNCLEALVRPANDWHRVNRMRFRDNPDALVERAEALAKIVKLKACAGKNVLLSSEYLFSLPGPEIERLLDRLGAPRDQVRVVMYIRDPKRYFCSHMQQIVKHDFAVRRPSASQYKFKRSICEWRNLVGHGQVSVLGFESEVSRHGDVVASFHSFLTTELNIQVASAPAAEPANISMSSEEAIALQEVKYSYGISPRARLEALNRAVNACIREASKPLKLSKAAFAPWLNEYIDSIFANDLQWLKNQYGLSFCLAEASAPVSRDAKAKFGSGPDESDFVGMEFQIGQSRYLRLDSVMEHNARTLRKLKLRAARKMQLRLK